jgi:hypothetical protein
VDKRFPSKVEVGKEQAVLVEDVVCAKAQRRESQATEESQVMQ